MKDSELREILFGPWMFNISMPMIYFIAWRPVDMWYYRVLALTVMVQIGIEVYIRLRKGKNDK